MAKTREQAVPTHDRICNLVPSRNTGEDWRFEAALDSEAIDAPPAKLPASVDLRADWWEVGNQESTGSCVGWASTDGVARYHFVKAKKLGEQDKLSPRCTWMASKETDQFVDRPETFIESAGTSLKAAADFLRKYGAAPETLLPFHVDTMLYAGDPNIFFATLATRRIASYFNLRKNTGRWREWLATQGPLLAGFSVDATWDKATENKGMLDTFQPGTVRGGHAIAVVGYTADGRFIIRNSWGKKWGAAGFAFASESYIKDAFYDEAYGFTV